MKPKEKNKNFQPIIWLAVLIVLELLLGAICYYKHAMEAKELVIDNCYVRGITYDDRKTLLVVQLPDHTLAIVDATIYRSRSLPERPGVLVGDFVRCRWKNGDVGKMGYCNQRKGDVPYKW